ncbi:MAG: PIN domain-containing protein [Anaeromyxobacteraceae bacterium]
MKRLVLDASALVSAACSPGGGAILVVMQAVRLGLVQLVVADEAEAEYRRAMEHERVRRYSRVPDRQAFVTALCAAAERVQPAPIPLPIRHPADALYLGIALAGLAPVVLSFNVRHFLPPLAANERRERHPRRAEAAGVSVMEPRLYLPELRDALG